MNAEEIKNWAIIIGSGATCITAIYSILTITRDYSLKLQAETRLKHTNEVELDIKLLTTFNEILAIAHACSSYQVSEKAIEFLLNNYKGIFDTNRIQTILDSAVITLPVGSAMQDAAIAAMAELGNKHPVLRQPAIHALQRMSALEGVKGYIAQNELAKLLKQDLGFIIRTFGPKVMGRPTAALSGDEESPGNAEHLAS